MHAPNAYVIFEMDSFGVHCSVNNGRLLNETANVTLHHALTLQVVVYDLQVHWMRKLNHMACMRYQNFDLPYFINICYWAVCRLKWNGNHSEVEREKNTHTREAKRVINNGRVHLCPRNARQALIPLCTLRHRWKFARLLWLFGEYSFVKMQLLSVYVP